MSQDDIDRRLEELGLRTESIGASSGFSERVMLAVQVNQAPMFGVELLRSATKLVPVAALAAVLAIVWAAVTQDATTELMAAVDPVELEW